MIGAEHTRKRDKGRGITPGSTGRFMPGLLIIISRRKTSQKVSVFLPVFMTLCQLACSCTAVPPDEVHCDIYITKGPSEEGRSLDIFFYDDDKERRLDSYHRAGMESGKVNGASRTGKKTIVAVANISEDRYTWSDINSLTSLEKMKAYLDEDSPEAPVMSGIANIDAGKEFSCSMKIRPVMSEVVLRSVRCDFSGRSYNGEILKDVKAYLTNVCNAWPILKDTLSRSSDYTNIGRADSSALKRMTHPEYIYKDIKGSIGSSPVKTDIHFYCYPNVTTEESMGSPYTRLVIEGTLGGQKYYYPLNVNRKDGSPGIERNTVYTMDVVITRRGAIDPDTAVDSASATVTVSVEDWKDKGKQYVSY